MIFNPVSSIKLMRQYVNCSTRRLNKPCGFDFDFWFFCFTFILNQPKCSEAKSFFSSNSTRSCHFLLQCKFNFNLVGAKNIRRRVFSPASLENNYLQRWIDKLQQMLPSTISILFVVILRMQIIMSHSQMLGKFEYTLPAKFWRLVGCTEMLSW